MPHLLIRAGAGLPSAQARCGRTRSLALIAIVAVVLAVLAGLDVSVGALSPFDLLAFAIGAVALHLAWPVAVRR